jgi:hypothetical protein
MGSAATGGNGCGVAEGVAGSVTGAEAGGGAISAGGRDCSDGVTGSFGLFGNVSQPLMAKATVARAITPIKKYARMDTRNAETSRSASATSGQEGYTNQCKTRGTERMNSGISASNGLPSSATI